MSKCESPILKMSVTKRFGNWELDVSFTTSSQRLVIWGPSGAGKTLTLMLIAGLITPDSGCIRVKGRDLFNSEDNVSLSPQIRRVGVVFQDYALFPHLRVEQNLGFALKRSASRNREITEMADILEISHLLSRYPSQLSGGQRQRVALGRAVLARPEILLLDEPFCALDSDLRIRLRAELVELLGTIDLPTITVTHDRDDVHLFGQEIAILKNGKCIGCRQVSDLSIDRYVPSPRELSFNPLKHRRFTDIFDYEKEIPSCP